MFPAKITQKLIDPARGRVNAFHRGMQKCAAELVETQWLSPDQLREIQQRKLAVLFQHTHKYSSFYRDILDAAGVDLQMTDLHDLERLPVLEKKQIRDNFEGITSSAYTREELTARSSGGSTGEPIWILRSESTGRIGAAIKRRAYGWTGWYPGAPHHWLWGAATDDTGTSLKSAFWNSLYNRKFTNAYETSDELFRHRHEAYIRRPPYLLESYANILYEFAKFIDDNGLPRLEIPAVITSAETLHEFQRDLIQRTISKDIYNRYGCREMGDMAHECNEHSGLHINMERFIVELDDTDDDGTGDLIITDLDNFAFPLIRYRIGDRARMSVENCPCGRGLEMLSEIRGRTLDVVVTQDGRKISGVLFPQVFKDFEQVILGQVIQHSITELEVRMRLKTTLSRDAEKDLVKKISTYTGPSMNIRINYADDILVTRTGKCRPVISNVA